MIKSQRKLLVDEVRILESKTLPHATSNKVYFNTRFDLVKRNKKNTETKNDNETNVMK